MPVDVEERLLQGVTVCGYDQQQSDSDQCLSCSEADADKQSCYKLEKRNAVAEEL